MKEKRKCSIKGCEREHCAKGYCGPHYYQIHNNRPIKDIRKKQLNKKKKVCSVKGCNEKHHAKGMCKYHYFHEYNSSSHPERFERLKEIRDKYFKTDKGKQTMKSVMGRRRARKKGSGVVENFTHLQVFQRDFFTCAICGLPVPVNEKHPSRLSASLDHFLALAKGGSHSLDNVNCTHWICNVSKNARILEPSFEAASI